MSEASSLDSVAGSGPRIGPPGSPALMLLLLCARTEIDTHQAQRILGLIRQGVDWNHLLSLAHRHGLIPILCKSLEGLGPDIAPPEIRGKLMSIADAFRLRSLVFLSELVRLQKAFAGAGIEVAPNKGPALAFYLYGDATLRQTLDIDLLVRARDAVKARRIILNQGYHATRHISPDKEAAWVKRHFEFTFRSKSGLSVELQWRIVPAYWRFPELDVFAWTKPVRLSLGPISVPWFEAERLLILLCLHGCKHKWDTLKWLVDIAQLLRKHPALDWHATVKCARAIGADRMLALGLLLSHDLLDAPLPPEILHSVRRKPGLAALAAEACRNASAVDSPHANTSIELEFLSRLVERWDMKFACFALRPVYFLLHRVLRPAATFAVGRTAKR